MEVSTLGRSGRLAAPSWLAAILLAGLGAPAAALDPARALDHYALDVWRAGLPQYTVQAVQQDRAGYLWLGTFEGLVRFNGATFEVFDQQNVPQVSAWHVRALAEDRDGTLWIGTLGNGLVRRSGDVFTVLRTSDGLSHDAINDLHAARDGSLWIATRNGLSRWRDGRFDAWHMADGLPAENVSGVVEQSDGRIAVGTPNGLARFDGTRFEPVPAADGAPFDVASLAISRDGALWIGTYAHGLHRIQGASRRQWSSRHGLPEGWVTAVLEDAQGEIYVTSAPGGLSRLDGDRVELLDRRRGLPSDSARALAEDREGSLWIGTNGGLARIKDLKFVNLTRRNGLPEDDVRVVLETADRSLWVGTYGGGLVRRRGSEWKSFGMPDGWVNAYIRTLAEDRDGSLWVGTQTGLNHIAGDTLESYNGRAGLVGTKVDALLVLRDGSLLVNTETGGVQRRRNGRFAPFLAKENELLRTARVLHETRDGHVWFGTAGSGLYETDGTAVVRKLTSADGLPDDAVFALREDADGTLWIGTHNGLARWREGRLTRLDAGHGMPEGTVFQILDDGRGILWLTSHRGLYAVPRAQVEAVLDGGQERLAPRLYGRLDGLGSEQCNGATQPAAAVLADGTLAIATVGGLTLVDPRDLHENAVPPPVHLTGARINGQPVTMGVRPHWSSRRFEFRYDGLSLLVPEAVRFRYRLQGFDRDWIDGSTARAAQYTALPPGAYRFQVLASNNDGVWSKAPAEFALGLAPPPWLRWWAFAAYAAAAALAVAALIKWRERRLVASNLALERRIAGRTVELSQANSALRETSDQLAAANLQLEALSSTDALTQLPNRRLFDATLAREWSRAQRARTPIALLMLDVDHFKLYNDHYGHPEGDECLRAVGAAIRGATRETDTPARYGGEEFAVISAGASQSQALVHAQHIVEAVRALGLPHAASPTAPHVTVSVGVACAIPGDCPDIEALIAAADAALYAAKRGGRDRAVGGGEGEGAGALAPIAGAAS